MASTPDVLVAERGIVVPKTPAQLFFDFAFPAYGKCLSHNPDKRAVLELRYLSGDPPNMPELERLFPVGILSLKHCAGDPRMPLEDITLEHVVNYLLHGHNEMIKSGKMQFHHTGSQEKEACKVREAEVVQKVFHSPELLVKYEDNTGGIVKSYRTPNASQGNRVYVHRDYTLVIPE